jgi:hypothetical protein
MKMRDPDVADLIDYANTHALEGNAREAKRVLEHGQKDFGNDPLLLFDCEVARVAGDDASAVSVERARGVLREAAACSLISATPHDTGAWERQRDSERIYSSSRTTRQNGIVSGGSHEAAVRLAPGERMRRCWGDHGDSLISRPPPRAGANGCRQVTSAEACGSRKAIRQRPERFDELESCARSMTRSAWRIYVKSVEGFSARWATRERPAT